MASGHVFDLSDPIDNLSYRVVKANSNLVAPTWEDRYESGEYRFALRDEDYIDTQRSRKADLYTDAYTFLAKIKTSKVKMYDFLSVYWMQNSKSKRPSEGADTDVYTGMLQEIIENDVTGFLKVAKDKNYQTKILILKALSVGLIHKEPLRREYTMADSGRYLGKDIDQIVQNILTPEFNDDLLRIEAVIKSQKAVAE
jgi:hypothetical protein